MARNASRLKLGYYPLPEAEAQRIRRCLRFPAQCAALDPCAGTGRALHLVTENAQCRRYGLELDSFRAVEAMATLDEVVQGSVFDTHAPVESFSLLYLNPPYDDEVADDRTRRTESVFLEHCYRWLQTGGVLVLVIPGKRLLNCSNILAPHFRDLAAYRLTEPEAVRFGQIALFGVRRSRRERDRMRDADINAARRWLSSIAYHCERLPSLDDSDRSYAVPAGNAHPALVYRGLPMDAIEDLLPSSRAWRQAGRIVFAPPVRIAGQPLTPLHEGHAAIVSCAGLLDGVFGQGESRHVACWQARKVTDRFEEEDENNVVTIRERERFTQSLTLVCADGRTSELSEEADAERTPSDGAP